MNVLLKRQGPQWAQLTYTSADSVTAGRGGWGVKEASAASDDVQAVLRQRVTTRMVEVEETSQFASDEELERRPRRLLASDVGSTSCLWHAVNAGQDATGRPGNVFTHAAAATTSDRLLRPVEYWRSPGWLTPYGAVDVNAARLGTLGLGSTVTRSSVLAFIEPFERSLALEWVLSAFAHARAVGITVALAAADPDEVAMWIGAMSFLTTPACARTFSWVTFERAAAIDDMRQQAVHVVGVPRVDVAELVASARPDVIVLDPDWAVSAEQLQDGHWTVEGQRFPASPWQQAMNDLLGLDPDRYPSVLARLDTIDAELAEVAAAEVPVHLPLAIALLEDPSAYPANLRSERLVDCFRSAGGELLWAQELMWSLIAGDVPDDTWSTLNRLPGFEAMVRRAADRELVQDYLAGTWRTGSAPDDLLDPEDVRRTCWDPMQAAIADARGVEGLAGAELVAVARLVTFVGLIWGDAPVDDLLAVLRPALSRAGLAADELVGLRRDLTMPDRVARPRWPGAERPPVGRPVIQPPDLGTPVGMAQLSPWAPGASSAPPPEADVDPPAKVAHASTTPATGRPVPPPPVPPPLLHVAAAESVPPSSPTWPALPTLLALLDDAELDHDLHRADALGDAVLATLGLRGLPLRARSAAADADLAWVVSLVSPPTTPELPPRAEGVLWGWFAVYQAMRDMGQESIAEKDLVHHLSSHGEAMLHGLAGYLRGCDPAALAQFVKIAVTRAVHNKRFLGQAVDDGPLGVVAIKVATPFLAPPDLAAAVDGARPSLGGLTGATQHLDDLAPAVANGPGGGIRSSLRRR